MRDPLPQLVAQISELRVARRMEVRVPPEGGDAAVPQVAINIVGERRRKGQEADPQQRRDRENPGCARGVRGESMKRPDECRDRAGQDGDRSPRSRGQVEDREESRRRQQERRRRREPIPESVVL
jgi:hypothetical protein